MIIKSGNKWLVKTKDGSKTLGTHTSKEDAEKQLRAIEASKHMKNSDMSLNSAKNIIQAELNEILSDKD